MEASLARKRAMANAVANAPAPVSPGADLPTSSGAMDSLLEKLRAAAPQARDQRDRRRRARLKERHQVRVASGQHMPDTPNVKNAEGGDDADDDGKDDDASNAGLLDPHAEELDARAVDKESVSEGEDIADRAASMLQGLRNNSDADAERARRRKESADEERRNRRMRRRNGPGGGSKSHISLAKEPESPTKTEPTEPDDRSLPSGSPHAEEEESLSQPLTPTIVVSESGDYPGSPPEHESSD